MAFDAKAFERALARDNPRFERFARSRMHELVAELRRPTPPMNRVARLASEVSPATWRKYRAVRRYLHANVAALRDVLTPRVIDYRTRSLTANAGGSIVHSFIWNSSTGETADLAEVYLREKVSWGHPGTNVQPYLDRFYQTPNQHFGMGNTARTRADLGPNRDEHSVQGGFGPKAFEPFEGSIHFTVHQVYQVSYDGGSQWEDIPGSRYTITRHAEWVGRRSLRLRIEKRSRDRPESCTNQLTLSL
jgi:hypothetical protein